MLPRLFQGFPEIKEALISNKVRAALTTTEARAEAARQLEESVLAN
jgi:hypothetical protein